MHSFLTRSVAAGLLIAAPALAQPAWLPFGTQIAIPSTTSVNTVNLGFNFTMPGGNVVTAVDIDTHGRIIEVGTDPSDSSETTGEMQSNPTGSINVCWDFCSYTSSPAAGLFFDTDNASVAVVTWRDISQAGVFTMQCQLYADGRIIMLYDSRMPNDDGIVAVSPGNGAALPAQSDISTATAAPLVSADPTVFEDFDFSAAGSTDLQATALEWVPNGAGGASGWTVNGTAGLSDPPVASSELISGDVCFLQRTYTYAPDGAGGYDVSSGPSVFDPNIGALAGATADDSITAIGLDLGFPMRFPDGTPHQFGAIDPNGRIVPTTAAGTFGDLSPSILDITTDGYPYFFGFWTDWNVTEPTSDGIYFNTIPGASATFTWNNVAQFGTDPGQPCTWQITLFNGGVVQITHQDLTGFNTPTHSSPDDSAVGLTAGALPDPGETDHSALTGSPTNVAGYVYEFWDSSGSTPVEPNDLQIAGPDLVSLNEPLQGTNWQVQTQNVGSSAFGLYVVGTASQSLFLGALGSPCQLLVSADLLDFQAADGLGNLNPYSLAIPVSPAINGTELFVQGTHEVTPGGAFGPFAGLPFGLILSNAVKGTVGSF